MKTDVLETLSAGKALTVLVLGKADRVFANSHRQMETKYHLRHGIFQRV